MEAARTSSPRVAMRSGMRFITTLPVAAIVFIVTVSRADAADCIAPHSIRQVRNGSGPWMEFVRFDINGSPNRPFQVTQTRPPFVADPSGRPVRVSGDKFKKITFKTVYWTCTIGERFSLPRRAVKDVKRLRQFEGVVEYVVGYNAASVYAGARVYPFRSNWRVVLRFRNTAFLAR